MSLAIQYPNFFGYKKKICFGGFELLSHNGLFCILCNFILLYDCEFALGFEVFFEVGFCFFVTVILRLFLWFSSELNILVCIVSSNCPVAGFSDTCTGRRNSDVLFTCSL